MVQSNHVVGTSMFAAGIGLLLAALFFSLQSEWVFFAAVDALLASAIVIAVEPFNKGMLAACLVLETGFSFAVSNWFNSCLGIYPTAFVPFSKYLAWGACGCSFSVLGFTLLVMKWLGLFKTKSVLVFVLGGLVFSLGVGLGVVNWFGFVSWTFVSCLLMAAGGVFLFLLVPVAEM